MRERIKPNVLILFAIAVALVAVMAVAFPAAQDAVLVAAGGIVAGAVAVSKELVTPPSPPEPPSPPVVPESIVLALLDRIPPAPAPRPGTDQEVDGIRAPPS